MLKVHTSNYRIEGFTKEVEPRDLAALARTAGVPFCNDLGSGTLVDLSRWGLKREPTVQGGRRTKAPTSSPSRATSSSAARRSASWSGGATSSPG